MKTPFAPILAGVVAATLAYDGPHAQPSAQPSRAQQQAQRDHAQQVAQHEHLQQMAEREHLQQVAQREHLQQVAVAERQHLQQVAVAEREHLQQVAATEHLQQVAEREHLQQVAEREHLQQVPAAQLEHLQQVAVAEHEHLQQVAVAEREHLQQVAATEHLQLVGATEHLQQVAVAQREQLQQVAELEHLQQMAVAQHLQQVAQRERARRYAWRYRDSSHDGSLNAEQSADGNVAALPPTWLIAGPGLVPSQEMGSRAALQSAAELAGPRVHVPVVSSASAMADLEAVRGDGLLRQGEVAEARRVYEQAALAGSAHGAFELGRTYDPAAPSTRGVEAVDTDALIAAIWYKRAQMLGSSEADVRLQSLNFRPAM